MKQEKPTMNIARTKEMKIQKASFAISKTGMQSKQLSKEQQWRLRQQQKRRPGVKPQQEAPTTSQQKWSKEPQQVPSKLLQKNIPRRQPKACKASVSKQQIQHYQDAHGQGRQEQNQYDPKGAKRTFSDNQKSETTQGGNRQKKNPSQGMGANYRQLQESAKVVDHALRAVTDEEERSRSAVKEYAVTKMQEKARQTAKHAGTKMAKGIGTVLKKATLSVVAFLAPFWTLILGIAVPLLLVFVLIMLVQKPPSSEGFFGKLYYWIEYETGCTDESAFGAVLGDGGKAFGIQFDYRYALQPFMRKCFDADPVAYAKFQPYLEVPKERLKGNQGLATTWIDIFETHKQDFIQKQKEYAKENYYDDIERKADQLGIKLKDRDDVCKGAVLSYSFQCGQGAAMAALKKADHLLDGDERFINDIYEYRTQKYPRFQSRYDRERATALALLHGQSGSETLTNPIPGARVSSEFGPRKAPTAGASTFHNGMDLAAARGTPIAACGDGTVIQAGYNRIRGNFVKIDHGGGIVTLYQHCDAVYVAIGVPIVAGQKIAIVGSTGVSTGAHLHFEVQVHGTPTNPRTYIRF
ncbi:MAG: peptidoglycan DD-metalloendopeptidase family protein [Lachnospiraceae bacterium]